jgi:hypothetical protein
LCYHRATERHDRLRTESRAPVPDQEVNVLKALRLGACALVMLTVPTAMASSSSTVTDRQIASYVHTLKRDRQVLRFFQRHPWLLTDSRFSREARRQIALHRRSLARAQKRIAELHRLQRVRVLAARRAKTPRAVICRVFGRHHCTEALRVSWCESHLQTRAQNGQYLGLFQMGRNERQLYGHGPSAEEQAQAAHRYFVASGSDWGPWSCKP